MQHATLGKLDAYICDLFDDQFVHIPERGEKISFRYDYHPLKRWLLKVSFNSARTHDALDVPVFQPLKPYILGKADDLERSVRLYVLLSYPGEVPAEDLADPAMAPFMFAPIENRLGQVAVRSRKRSEAAARGTPPRVHFLPRLLPSRRVPQGYGLFRGTSPAEQSVRTTSEAIPDERRARLRGMDAWQIVRDARAVTFVTGEADGDR
ncbi:MAG TPA: hypothetical protein VFR21_22805 [Bradyrhizobium sp.]|nr:hypothetical protein [Bradyrhizobium sp.]